MFRRSSTLDYRTLTLQEVASEIQRSVHQQLDDPSLQPSSGSVRSSCGMLAHVPPMRIDGRRISREHLHSVQPIRASCQRRDDVIHGVTLRCQLSC